MSEQERDWLQEAWSESPDVTIVVGADGRALYASPSAERLLGYSLENWTGRDTWEAVHPHDRASLQRALTSVLEGGGLNRPFVFRVQKIDGSYVAFEALARGLPEETGQNVAVVSLRDVSARTAAEEDARMAARELEQALADLHHEQAFVQVLLDNLEEGIVACDAEGRITLANPAGGRICGLLQHGNEFRRASRHPSGKRSPGSILEVVDNPLGRALAGEVVRDAEIHTVDEEGGERVLLANAQALYDEDGRKLGAVMAMHDVTDQKLNEARLADLALKDPLTGAANRLLLDDRLRRAFDRMRRRKLSLGVFLLDLDGFKAVNDRYGHDVGDDILVSAARRVQAAVRPEDTVARLGGDEFVVVCEVSGGQREVERIRRRLNAALAEPYRIGPLSLTVQGSVGGVLVDEVIDDPAVPLARADEEMYRVKAERGRLPLEGSRKSAEN